MLHDLLGSSLLYMPANSAFHFKASPFPATPPSPTPYPLPFPPPLQQRYAPLALLHALEGQALNTASGASMADSEERTMYNTVQELAREEVRAHAGGKDASTRASVRPSVRLLLCRSVDRPVGWSLSPLEWSPHHVEHCARASDILSECAGKPPFGGGGARGTGGKWWEFLCEREGRGGRDGGCICRKGQKWKQRTDVPPSPWTCIAPSVGWLEMSSSTLAKKKNSKP